MYSNCQNYCSQRKPPLGAVLNPYLLINRGLVGCWLFNEGSGDRVFDSSGNGRRGAIDFGIIWTPGKFDSCLDFSGGDFGVNCGNDDVLNLFATGRSGTISFWAKIPSVPAGDTWRLVAKSDNVNVRSIEIFYRSMQDDLWLQVYDGIARKKVQTATTGLDDNVWRHYCFSVSPAFTKVYINGIDDSMGEIAGNIGVTGISNLYLGRDDSVNTLFFYDGYLDCVMLYNRALSASEISLLYREPFCGFRWPLNKQLAQYAEYPPEIRMLYMDLATRIWTVKHTKGLFTKL